MKFLKHETLTKWSAPKVCISAIAVTMSLVCIAPRTAVAGEWQLKTYDPYQEPAEYDLRRQGVNTYTGSNNNGPYSFDEPWSPLNQFGAPYPLWVNGAGAGIKCKGRGREIYQWIREGDTPEERALDNPPALVYFGVDVTAGAGANGYPDDGQQDSGSETASVTVMGEQGSPVISPDETVVSARVIRVLQAVPDGDEVKSPWCDIEATSSVGSNRVDSMGNPVWGRATTWFSFDIRLVNIYAQTPNPAGDPTLGQNEYVMVGGGPPFALPSRIAVTGPYPGATSPIIDYVRQNSGWTVARPLPGALPAIANGQDNGGVFPQFRSDQDGPPGTLMQGNGTSTQNGLPASNGDFGINSVTHLFEGATLGVSNIEVFYAAAVSTHPPGGPPGYYSSQDANGEEWADHSNPCPTPNWFYYYDQVWQNPWGIPVVYWPGDYAYFWSGDPGHIHISDLAHGDTTPTGYGAALFAILPGSPYVQHVGWENVRGIDNYTRTVTHECVHKRLHEAAVVGVNDNDVNAAGAVVGDGVPDSIETIVGLDPNTPYTTTFDDDEEVFCRMTEHSVPLANANADWADDGLNRGTPPPPNFSQRTVRSTPGYDPNTLNLPNAYAVIP